LLDLIGVEKAMLPVSSLRELDPSPILPILTPGTKERPKVADHLRQWAEIVRAFDIAKTTRAAFQWKLLYEHNYRD